MARPHSFDETLNTLHKAMQSPKLPEEQQWQSISELLRAVIAALIAWGQRIKSASPPDAATVHDAVQGLDILEDRLNELLEWLEEQALPFSYLLQTGVSNVLEECWTPASKAALTMYLRWLDNPDKADNLDKEKWYEEQRITAGRNIIAFANALGRALRDIEESRRNR